MNTLLLSKKWSWLLVCFALPVLANTELSIDDFFIAVVEGDLNGSKMTAVGLVLKSDKRQAFPNADSYSYFGFFNESGGLAKRDNDAGFYNVMSMGGSVNPFNFVEWVNKVLGTKNDDLKLVDDFILSLEGRDFSFEKIEKKHLEKEIQAPIKHKDIHVGPGKSYKEISSRIHIIFDFLLPNLENKPSSDQGFSTNEIEKILSSLYENKIINFGYENLLQALNKAQEGDLNGVYSLLIDNQKEIPEELKQRLTAALSKKNYFEADIPKIIAIMNPYQNDAQLLGSINSLSKLNVNRSGESDLWSNIDNINTYISLGFIFVFLLALICCLLYILKIKSGPPNESKSKSILSDAILAKLVGRLDASKASGSNIELLANFLIKEHWISKDRHVKKFLDPEVALPEFKKEVDRVYQSFVQEPDLRNALIPAIHSIADAIDHCKKDKIDPAYLKFSAYIKKTFPQDVADIFVKHQQGLVLYNQGRLLQAKLESKNAQKDPQSGANEEKVAFANRLLMHFGVRSIQRLQADLLRLDGLLPVSDPQQGFSQRVSSLERFFAEFWGLPVGNQLSLAKQAGAAESLGSSKGSPAQTSLGFERESDKTNDGKTGENTPFQGEADPQEGSWNDWPPDSKLQRQSHQHAKKDATRKLDHDEPKKLEEESHNLNDWREVFRVVRHKLNAYDQLMGELQAFRKYLPPKTGAPLSLLERYLSQITPVFSGEDLHQVKMELEDICHSARSSVVLLRKARGDSKSKLPKFTLKDLLKSIEQDVGSLAELLSFRKELTSLAGKGPQHPADVKRFFKQKMILLAGSEVGLKTISGLENRPEKIFDKLRAVIEPLATELLAPLDCQALNTKLQLVTNESSRVITLHRGQESLELYLKQSGAKGLSSFSALLAQICEHFGTQDFRIIANAVVDLDESVRSFLIEKRAQQAPLLQVTAIRERLKYLRNSEQQYRQLQEPYQQQLESGRDLPEVLRRDRKTVARFEQLSARYGQQGQTSLAFADFFEQQVGAYWKSIRLRSKDPLSEHFSFSSFGQILSKILRRNDDVESLVAEKEHQAEKARQQTEKALRSLHELNDSLGFSPGNYEQEAKTLAKGLDGLLVLVDSQQSIANSFQERVYQATLHLQRLKDDLATLNPEQGEKDFHQTITWTIAWAGAIQSLAFNFANDLGFDTQELSQPRQLTAFAKQWNLEKEQDLGPLRLGLATAKTCWRLALDEVAHAHTQNLAEDLALDRILKSLDDLISKLATTPSDRLWNDAVGPGFARGALNNLLRAQMVLETFYLDKPQFAYLLQAIRLAGNAIQTAVARQNIRFVRVDLLRDGLNAALCESQGSVDETYTRVAVVRKQVQQTLAKGNKSFLVDMPKWPFFVDGKLSKGKACVVHPGQWLGGSKS